MPLFACSKCNCVENTALSGYWSQQMRAFELGQEFKPLCSEHNADPDLLGEGKWHGKFEKRSAVGMMIGANGFLYTKQEVADGRLGGAKQVVGEVQPQ